MKLYHYTHEDALPSILAEGLTKGDVPLSPKQGTNAVWFTTSISPDGHGILKGGSFVVDEKEALIYGVPAGTVVHYADKQKIRIQVGFQTSKTPGLYKWLDFAKAAKIDRSWLKTLHKVAGDDPKPNTWWLWFAPMPPEYFQAVEVRSPDGYVSIWERPDLLAADVRQAVFESAKAA